MRTVKRRTVPIPATENDVLIAVPSWSVPYITGLLISLQDGARTDPSGAARVRGAMATMGESMIPTGTKIDALALKEQATPPAGVAASVVIYAENGSVLRTIRPSGGSGQLAELDRAQTWSKPQRVSETTATTPLLFVTSDTTIVPDRTLDQALVELAHNGQTGVSIDGSSDTGGLGPHIYMRRSRGSLVSKASVVAQDKLGEVQFWGMQNGANRIAARIYAYVTGTPANDRVPTDVLIYTADTDHEARVALRVRKTGALWVGNVSSSSLDSDGDITTVGRVQGTAFHVGANQVVGARGAAVSDVTGGSVVDVQARSAINALLARLRAHGLITT
jgi:hypothetical protein